MLVVWPFMSVAAALPILSFLPTTPNAINVIVLLKTFTTPLPINSSSMMNPTGTPQGPSHPTTSGLHQTTSIKIISGTILTPINPLKKLRKSSNSLKLSKRNSPNSEKLPMISPSKPKTIQINTNIQPSFLKVFNL
jgi:hypothetical protein